MLATVAAADSASTVRKKYSVFIYIEAEPHALQYAICKQTRTLCVLQYLNYYYLGVILEIVLRIFDTFATNLEIKNDFANFFIGEFLVVLNNIFHSNICTTVLLPVIFHFKYVFMASVGTSDSITYLSAERKIHRE